MLRCPDSVTPETRVVTGGEYRIGRGLDNDWILPDQPPRLLSKQHCRFEFRSGRWQITDVSTNGTFLNDETSPIGDKARPMCNGDRLALGAYEIEVELEVSEDIADIGNFWHDNGSDAQRDRDVGLSSDIGPPQVFRGEVQSDHSPAVDDVYRPRPAVIPIPVGWDLDEVAPETPAPISNTRRPTVRDSDLPVRDGNLMAAFLRGAGAEGAIPDDPVRTMEALGEVLRATVVGLRQALIARLSVKSEFRIEQTMIRANGNNPLKFSAGDDDALAAILGVGRRNAMPPAAAVAEALLDIRLHELATMAAMQEAVRALLARLDPAALERQAVQGGFGKLLNQGKARAWDAFAALHGEISRALSDDFDSVFGKAFARAYEQALRDLTGREGRT
jgi:type VI secretion system protein ImpI/type VI secretion system protein